MTHEEKAQQIYDQLPDRLYGTHLIPMLARALREARAEGMREAADIIMEWQDSWNDHQHALSIAANRIRKVASGEEGKE